MKSTLLHPLALVLLSAIPESGITAGVDVWTVDEMQRVMRSDPPGSDHSAAIQAARGEWESFQVIVRGDTEDVAPVKIVAHPAVQAQSGAALPPPIVFREHYVRVSSSTPMSSLPKGDYPDALLPMDMPSPSVNPPEGVCNQPFWVDVFVPYPSPAGLYKGNIEVTIRGQKHPICVDYSVEVWDIDLPVVPRLRTSFGLTWRRIAEVHGFDRDAAEPTPEFADLIDQYATLLAEHRLSVDQIESTYPDGSTGEMDKPAIERAMRDHLLHRHASTLGLPIWPEWPFGDPLGKDRDAAQKYAADWMKLLGAFKAESRGYVIMGGLDEPNDAEAYDLVRKWGAFFNEASKKYGIQIPLLITEQPTPDREEWGRLDGAVDIWVPHFSSVWEDMEAPNAPRGIARRLAAGDEVWAYAALVQCPGGWEDLHGNPKALREGHPPVWALDYPAMNHRILGWLLPLHGITGLAYWDMLYAAEGVDVWADAGSFHHPRGDVYNGDGSYLYPATKARFGKNAPVPSIRLKWIREAAEDYDYLMLAKDLGLENEARELTNAFARGFGDWSDDIPALHQARQKLAALIVDAQSKKGGGS